MKIGFSSRMGPRTYWNEWFRDRGHTVLEISLGKNYLSFEPERLTKLLPVLKDLDLSMHTMTTCLFSNEDTIINEAQRKTLLAEIKVASCIGAKELIFHMPVDVTFDKIEVEAKKFFDEAIDFSNEHNVSLVLENNAKGSFSSKEDMSWFLEKIANIGLCLDIGHLNRASRVYGVNMDEFVNSLRSKIKYMHVHNNFGDSDSHNSLAKGNFPYDKYLPLLTSVRKYIIETNSYEDAIETERLLIALLKR